MDFSPNDRQKLIRDTVRQFMEAEVRPFVKGGMAYSASETRAPEPHFRLGQHGQRDLPHALWGTGGDPGL